MVAKGRIKFMDNGRTVEIALEKMKNGSWTPNYGKRVIKVTQIMNNFGYSPATIHAAQRAAERLKNQRALDNFEKTLAEEANYYQEDGRLVKYYNGVGAIINPETNEIISVVNYLDRKWDSYE
jgi:hypothetical protein